MIIKTRQVARRQLAFFLFLTTITTLRAILSLTLQKTNRIKTKVNKWKELGDGLVRMTKSLLPC